jgi:hypothetical protein
MRGNSVPELVQEYTSPDPGRDPLREEEFNHI